MSADRDGESGLGGCEQIGASGNGIAGAGHVAEETRAGRARPAQHAHQGDDRLFFLALLRQRFGKNLAEFRAGGIGLN